MANQKEVAEHLDLTDRHVRRLLKDGVIPPSKSGWYDLDACRLAYIRYLRGVQSGQVKSATAGEGEQPEGSPSGDFTALLEQEKYRKAKRENDIEEGLVAPVALLADALQKSGAIIVANLESLPLLMKRHWPEITGDQVTMVKKAIAECRNAIADMRIED